MSATSDAPVLISSDDGMDARAIGAWIHALSPRRTGQLIVLDSRRLQADVHFERFEPANDPFARFRAADQSVGSTLLLTHLESMPLGTQTRLCRFLDRRASTATPALRVMATTDRLIHTRVQAGHIREELFYRLNVIHIVLAAKMTNAERQEFCGGTGLRMLVRRSSVG